MLRTGRSLTVERDAPVAGTHDRLALHWSRGSGCESYGKAEHGRRDVVKLPKAVGHVDPRPSQE